MNNDRRNENENNRKPPLSVRDIILLLDKMGYDNAKVIKKAEKLDSWHNVIETGYWVK